MERTNTLKQNSHPACHGGIPKIQLGNIEIFIQQWQMQLGIIFVRAMLHGLLSIELLNLSHFVGNRD